MITYSVKLLTLGKATRAPYKRAPASELSFCCRSGRATARPLLNILLLSSLAKRSKHISFYLFKCRAIARQCVVSCYFSFREVSMCLLFIIRILCYSLLKRVSVYLLLYEERAKRAYIFFVIFLPKKVNMYIIIYIIFNKRAVASVYYICI